MKEERSMSRIQKIIKLYFTGHYTDKTRRDFFEWYNHPHRRTEKDSELLDLWNKLNVDADDSTEVSYEELLARLEIPSVSSVCGVKKTYSWKKIGRVAAMFIMPLFCVALSCYILNSVNTEVEPVKFVECFVPNGETRTITLPDSSKVELNAGSIIIYPEQFTGSTRSVYLNGEAYFVVSKDVNRPFVVSTSSVEIEVLGTIFNVSSYVDSDSATATLEEGSVRVEIKNRGEIEPVVLVPNQQIAYNKLTGVVETRFVEIDHAIAWHEGNLVFQGESMYEVIKMVERKFGVEVYLSSSKFDNQKITAKFVNDESLADVLKVLKLLVPNIQYKVEGQKVYIH